MRKKITMLTMVFIFFDLVSKYLIDNFFSVVESTSIIKNFFYITKVYNDGASWNFLSGNRIILIIITIILLVILLLYQNKFKNNFRNILAFGMLYGGIIGNLINRITDGYVIDFLDFKIFGYDYPVFNLADIFIVIGIFFLIIAIYKKEDENEFSSK